MIGAQAVYLHMGAIAIAIAETTKDSDLSVDPRVLDDEPLIDDAMTRAGFHRDLAHPQPGSWLSPHGIPVDLMVPEALAGAGGRRGARIPPHSRHAIRRTPGLEAAVVDHSPMTIRALDSADERLRRSRAQVRPRCSSPPTRQWSPAASSISPPTRSLALSRRRSPTCGSLFASPTALGAVMTGRAEELVGNPAVAAAAVLALAADVLFVIDQRLPPP